MLSKSLQFTLGKYFQIKIAIFMKFYRLHYEKVFEFLLSVEYIYTYNELISMITQLRTFLRTKLICFDFIEIFFK